jgi:hypothetical protein
MGVTGKSMGTYLGTRLGVRLGTDLAPNTAASFSDATFTNASARYLSYGSTAPSVTSFAGGTLATRVIGGRTFAQIELAVENVLTRSEEFDHANWTKIRSTVSANNTTDPLNTSTADKLVEDATAASTHFIRQTHTPDGASSYVFSVYAKAGERTWIRMLLSNAGFPGNETCYFDLGNGVLGTSTAEDEGMEDAGDGWYRCWAVATSDAAAATLFDIHIAEGDNDISFDGDGSSGVYLWGAQLEIGTAPTSPIKTEAASVTRAKDQLSWLEADVPAALRRKITFKWIPWVDSTLAADRYLAYFNHVGQRIAVYYAGAVDKIRVRDIDAAANKVQSNALTFSRLQELTITIDPSAGSVTVSGATAGDGTVTSTAWSTSSGDVAWGSTTAFGSQCNGLISEPY